MYTYNIDGTNYTFSEEIGEEEARRRVTITPGTGTRRKNQNPRYEGFFTEAGEGVASGLTKIPEGIATTGTLVYDAITGGNATATVEKWFDDLREDAGIDPEGAAGKVTEALVQFGIPGLYAASAISKVGKLATGTGKAGSLLRPDRFITGPGTRVTSALLKRFAPDTKKALTNIERRRRIREGEVKIGTKKVGETDARELSTFPTKRARDIETKSQKVGRYAVLASAAGFADAVVSTDDTQTIGDFFEAGPTNTIDAVGKEGQERAFAKILNKMKVGIEGGVATAVLPPAFLASLNVANRTLSARPTELLDKISPTLGGGLAKALPTGKETTVLDIASGFTVPMVREGIKGATRRILQREQEILQRGIGGEEGVSTLQGIIGRMEALARYRGFLNPVVARLRSLINPEVEGNIKLAKQQMQEIDDQIKVLLKKDRFASLPDQHKKKYIDNFMDVLEGAVKREDIDTAVLTGRRLQKAEEAAAKITDLPTELYDLYRSAKKTIEDLTNQFVDSNVVKELPEQAVDGGISRGEFQTQIRKIAREGGYLRRQYRIYNDKNFKLDPKAKEEIIRKIMTGEGVDIGHVRGILSGTAHRLTDTQAAELYAGRLNFTREQATRYIDEVTTKAKLRGGRGLNQSRIFQNRLDVSLIQKRKVDSDVLKAILGEIRDPREAFISTVSELSNFIATDRFLQLFKNSVDANIAQVAARNSRLAAGADPEKQVFFNMDDEVLNIIRNNPSEFQGVDVTTISRTSDLDSASIQKAVRLFEENNPNHVILGRSSDTTPGGDYTAGANATKSIYGTMFGYAVPRVMFNNLSNAVWADADTMPTFLRQVYGTMQKLKGATQYAKTILSPLTQVRNVTSASMFALAQGNYGKGSSLGTSVNTVLRDIVDKELKLKNITFLDLERDGKTLDFLVEMQKRGVIGSSAQLREIQDNLRKGLGYESKGDYVTGQVSRDLRLPGEVGGQGGQRSPEFKVTRRSKLGQFFEGPLNVAEDLYRGGDDIWKIYNYFFELNKLKNARRKMQNEAIQSLKKTNPSFTLDDISRAVESADNQFGRHINFNVRRQPDPNDPGVQQVAFGPIQKQIDEAMKQFAADNVRNLVPNYELVPDLIKGLRGLPVGNFIAFPAEILRTGFNTLDVALKELTSDSAAIREIGARRLTNAVFTFGVLGEGMQRFGQFMTGTSDDELDAINRRAAPWQKNAQLIPVGKDKDGNPEVIDFSHTNPWDLLSKPFHTVLKSLREGTKLDKSGVQNARGAIYDAMGEFFEPFFGVSMIYDAFFDVLPKEGISSFGVGRGGVTQSGAKVYKEADSSAMAIEKSFLHILNTMKPNVLPIRIPTGADIGLTSALEGRDFEPVKSIELGRTTRGVLFPEGGEFLGFNVNAEEPTTGRDYTAAGEIFRAFTGLQTQIIDRDKILQFTGQEFKGERSSAATLFSDALRLENPTDNQMIEAYIRADDARLKAFRKMKLAYDDFKKMGLRDVEIRKILKQKAGLGNREITSLQRDRYRPYKIDKKKRIEARRKGIKIPMNAINRIFRNRLNMRLTPEPVRKEPAPDVRNILNTAPINTPELPPMTQNVVPQQQTTNVVQNTINNELFRTDPRNREIAAFLGSNPEEVLKNMQIARRTG